jgi:hypothetical protein
MAGLSEREMMNVSRHQSVETLQLRAELQAAQGCCSTFRFGEVIHGVALVPSTPAKDCIYDPSIVPTRALPTVRHQQLENRPFLIAEIKSRDPPPVPR